jgi:two-component system chemotaxis response regulator CheB
MIQVVGVASNSVKALEMVARLSPDVITMDIHMPVMDGFEATRCIMETVPTPIVIVSGSTKEVSSTFQAIEAGALAVVLRPPGLKHEIFAECAKELIQTVKLMSEIKVIRRVPRVRNTSLITSKINSSKLPAEANIQLIAIGASTGGPPALLKILSRLPADFPVPILIVQHITAGFCAGFTEWIGSASKFPVHLASHNMVPLPGHAYVAPDDFHMGVVQGPVIVLSNQPPENLLRPSVAYLFRTVAKVMGSGAVGVLLTGMGRDGADELKLMKDCGAVTIVQDEKSSIVFGMPGEAVKLVAANHILPPEDIADLLVTLVNSKKGDNHGR